MSFGRNASTNERTASRSFGKWPVMLPLMSSATTTSRGHSSVAKKEIGRSRPATVRTNASFVRLFTGRPRQSVTDAPTRTEFTATSSETSTWAVRTFATDLAPDANVATART
jgi:hypothetical protein